MRFWAASKFFEDIELEYWYKLLIAYPISTKQVIKVNNNIPIIEQYFNPYYFSIFLVSWSKIGL